LIAVVPRERCLDRACRFVDDETATPPPASGCCITPRCHPGPRHAVVEEAATRLLTKKWCHEEEAATRLLTKKWCHEMGRSFLIIVGRGRRTMNRRHEWVRIISDVFGNSVGFRVVPRGP